MDLFSIIVILKHTDYPYCCDFDNAEITLFNCLRWSDVRKEVWAVVGALNGENMADKMTEDNWKRSAPMLTSILSQKMKKEPSRCKILIFMILCVSVRTVLYRKHQESFWLPEEASESTRNPYTVITENRSVWWVLMMWTMYAIKKHRKSF